jgi:hypothetical protein
VKHERLFPKIEIEAGDINRIEAKISKQIVISLAGLIAERRFNRRSRWRDRGQHDHETAADLALTMNGGDEKATNAYLKWLSRRAQRLIENEWPLVTACAERLMREKTLGYRDIMVEVRGQP